jgi:hypothetical protein
MLGRSFSHFEKDATAFSFSIFQKKKSLPGALPSYY